MRVQVSSLEQAGGSLPAIRVIPGWLERLIGQFQQEPVLWIHRLGFRRREAEESCVKTARLLQDRRGFYVARVAEIGWRHARFQDLLIGKPSNRLDACGQVTPELVDVARAWEATGHPDDGDIGLGMHGSHQRPTRMTGSGKALRSAFPLGVTGIASILSNRLGII